MVFAFCSFCLRLNASNSCGLWRIIWGVLRKEFVYDKKQYLYVIYIVQYRQVYNQYIRHEATYLLQSTEVNILPRSYIEAILYYMFYIIRWLCNHRNLSIAKWSCISNIDFWAKWLFVSRQNCFRKHFQTKCSSVAHSLYYGTWHKKVIVYGRRYGYGYGYGRNW